MIQIKRAYEEPEIKDGHRVLVDHLWPRGISKEKLKCDAWVKEVAPSNSLRQWFNHEPAKWPEFQKRYFAELRRKPEVWKPLLKVAQSGDLTFVYGARDTKHNNAVALKLWLEKNRKQARTRTPGRRMQALTA